MAEPSRAQQTPVDAAGARFLIVEARFYDAIGAMLLDGATRALKASGASFEIVTVPGCLELPLALALALDSKSQASEAYDGAIALGCIIRGETYHFEIVANESARALTQLAVERLLPFGNGVLTVENDDQAVVRADPDRDGGDKGGDAARAALALWALKTGGQLRAATQRKQGAA